MRTTIPSTHITDCVDHKTNEAGKHLLHLINTGDLVKDADYATHYDYISCVAEELDAAKINTRTAYADRLDKHDWVYDANRAAIHEKIIEEELASWGSVPKNREAIMTGGLIGSGKTSTLRYHAGIDMNSYALLSADIMKIKFSEKGLVPELKGFLPMEASILTYKETNHVVWKLFERAYAEGYNLIYDTMMGAKEATFGKLVPLQEEGYVVDGLFVDVEIDTALRRAKLRHRAGLNKFIVEGKGYGGRLLPEESITEQESSKFYSHNREVFEEVIEAGGFREARVFDNNIDKEKPTLIQKVVK